MKRRNFLLGVGVVALAGCSEPVTHATGSGKPEVSIATSNRTAVKSKIVNAMLDAGYTLTKDNDFTMSFDKPVDNAMAAIMLGSSYDGTPNERITFTIVEANGATRVIADPVIITNPGSSFERRTPMSNSQASLEVQKGLNNLKRSMEG